MAVTVAYVMNGVMARPDVAVIGLAVGFILAKALDMRKKRNRMGFP